jgi:hypothetical protein
MNTIRSAALREAHLVRDDHHRHAISGQFEHAPQDLSDHLGIERRRRLVEQHSDRIDGERACDGDPLLLTRRKAGSDSRR